MSRPTVKQGFFFFCGLWVCFENLRSPMSTTNTWMPPSRKIKRLTLDRWALVTNCFCFPSTKILYPAISVPLFSPISSIDGGFHVNKMPWRPITLETVKLWGGSGCPIGSKLKKNMLWKVMLHSKSMMHLKATVIFCWDWFGLPCLVHLLT